MIQIRCKDLQVGYEGKAVSSKLNFCVKEGEYFCVVGENGAGKSTLIKTLLQLQKSVGGEIHFENGFDLSQIGYLPQQTMIQKDFPASVREIILSGCHKENRWNPFYTAKQKKMASDAMSIMNIEHLDKRCYRELSGGQQQRVLLARALCAAKKMLFLDEPVAGLDPEASEAMYQMIRKLNKEYKITIFMISHDIKTVMTDATHVLHVGKNVFYGTKEEYLVSNIGKKFIDIGGTYDE